jgi:hypothetical protein
VGEAETHQCLLMNRAVLPWLLDSTPLPQVLSHVHAIGHRDPHVVANQVANGRRRERRRVAIGLAACAALLVPMAWMAPRFLARSNLPFRGHVLDEEGKPVSGALVEVGAIRDHTGADGAFGCICPARRDRPSGSG